MPPGPKPAGTRARTKDARSTTSRDEDGDIRVDYDESESFMSFVRTSLSDIKDNQLPTVSKKL